MAGDATRFVAKCEKYCGVGSTRLYTEGECDILNSTMSEERLTEVESSLAFLERTVHELSDVVRGQYDEIDRLNGKIQAVEGRLNQVESPEPADADPQMEKPPHY